MLMSMVRIGKMRVAVLQWYVLVPMAVSGLRGYGCLMGMFMVRVRTVGVGMVVCQCSMPVAVQVAFYQMQQHAHGHQRATP